MSSSYLLILPFCFFLFACQNKPIDDGNEISTIPVTAKKFSSNSTPCPDSLISCAEVEINVPFILDHSTADLINKSILKELSLIMENLPPDLNSLQDIPTKIDTFISQHRNFSNDVDFPQLWSFKINFDILENNDNSLSILLNSNIYTGGAHPINDLSILTFNPDSGKKVIFSDIIKDEKSLKTLIVQEFKRKRNLSDSVNLTDEGYYSNDWPLPKNFALLAQGLYIVYNAYEIGPYVLGTTELLIPIDAIKPLLKD
ncbi:MAG: DUF3298 and DUF4163 domain-containing protein [Saprospiraceae bacterium]|nr:DUF3298 and DUF4163 domain-containing protein [Saprospiraceae bacterium]MDP4813405.1 DUF3298 and DUF4163 domain-containing protein [Saprospiraceae bacterium]MDP4853606.1 DUF3298 and DUF4163 domain-containing protein [Saprospiraceae bacterium]